MYGAYKTTEKSIKIQILKSPWYRKTEENIGSVAVNIEQKFRLNGEVIIIIIIII